jgi:hypothetical protein
MVPLKVGHFLTGSGIIIFSVRILLKRILFCHDTALHLQEEWASDNHNIATAPSVCAAVAQSCPRLQLLYKQNVAAKHVKSTLQISPNPQNPDASELIPFFFYNNLGLRNS